MKTKTVVIGKHDNSWQTDRKFSSSQIKEGSIVYCAHCGTGDQQPDAYCKACGKYLYNHSLLPSDAPADKAAWLAIFSAITVIVCLIGEIYPASKLSSNPAFPSIIILQLFSMLVAYSLRRRLKRKHGVAPTSQQRDTVEDLPEKVDLLLPANPATVTERTTTLMDPLPSEAERE